MGPVRIVSILLLLLSCSLAFAQPYYLMDSSLKEGYRLYYQGAYEKAGQMFLIGLKQAQHDGNKRIEAEAYRLLGEVNRASRNSHYSLKYLNSAEEIFRELGDDYGIASTKNRKAAVFFEITDSASYLNLLNASIKISRDKGYKDLLYNNLTILGAHEFVHRKNFLGAIEILREALSVAQDLGKREDYPYIYNNFARLFREAKQTDSALYYAHASLKLGEEFQIRSYVATAAGQLSLIYHEKKDYENAWRYERRYNIVLDSINQESRDKEVGELVEKYQYDRQQQELALQEEQFRYAIIALAIFLSLLILIAVLFFKYRRQHARLAEVQKQTESQNITLEENNRLKDRLLSVLSHDLRSPMANLHHSLDLICSGDVSKEDEKMLMEELNIRVQRTSQLLDNLLFWIKNQIDRIPVKKETLSLWELCREAQLLMEKSIQQKNLLLDTHVPVDIHLFADKEMLRLVIRNLLSNAIKFSYEKSVIYLKAWRDAQGVYFEIRDQGVGISSAKLEEIFSARQLSTSGTHDELGMGIGLSVVRDFVDANGGDIQVESEVGKGAVFRLRFPGNQV